MPDQEVAHDRFRISKYEIVRSSEKMKMANDFTQDLEADYG